jgi:hypothetical protein
MRVRFPPPPVGRVLCDGATGGIGWSGLWSGSPTRAVPTTLPGESVIPLNTRVPSVASTIVRSPVTFAMQKVVGSSPIIRSENPCKKGSAVAWVANDPSLVATLRYGSSLQATITEAQPKRLKDSNSSPGAPSFPRAPSLLSWNRIGNRGHAWVAAGTKASQSQATRRRVVARAWTRVDGFLFASRSRGVLPDSQTAHRALAAWREMFA